MRITTRTWNNYIARLSRLNEAAGQKMREYIRLHGTDDTEALISYAYAVITRYGEDFNQFLLTYQVLLN